MKQLPPTAELRVRVTIRASSARLEPDGKGACRVWVCAPPSEGEANKEVVELVAKSLGLAKSNVAVVRGTKSRDKVLSLRGLSEDAVQLWLTKLAGGDE